MCPDHIDAPGASRAEPMHGTTMPRGGESREEVEGALGGMGLKEHLEHRRSVSTIGVKLKDAFTCSTRSAHARHAAGSCSLHLWMEPK